MNRPKKQVSILRPCFYDGPSSDPADSHKRRKILIAEDSVTETARLKLFLRNHGYECILANEVTTAIKLAAQHQPDLFLIDLGITGQNGLLLIHKLKYIPGIKSAAILITGENEDLLDKQQALNMGAAAFLNKPLKNHEVLTAIKAVFCGDESPQQIDLVLQPSAA